MWTRLHVSSSKSSKEQPSHWDLGNINEGDEDATVGQNPSVLKQQLQ